MESLTEQQQAVCRANGAAFDPPAPGTVVGIALRTLGRLPIHGVRVPPTETTCGWYLHAGDEPSDADDFYQPLCVEHLPAYCAPALPFVGLPPGWRFMTDGQGFSDVWQDP
ncbi:MAG: immunity protein Imm33 domain-containing protein [Gemmataceae bacterium]